MSRTLKEIVQLVDNLTEETKPLWGKMSAQHMVEHMVFSMRISNGKLKTTCFIPQERWPTIRKVLMSDRPLPHNFVNPIIGENLLPLEFNNFAEAKENLLIEYENYLQYFEDHPDAILLNPTFGELNKDEWEIFHKKHFTHHFQQFGLL